MHCFFDNVKLGNRNCSSVFVNFVNDQAYEAQFLFRPELKAKSIDFYNELSSDINGVYGAGKEYKKFKEPYKEGDGYEITAIKAGNADYSIFWQDSANYIGARVEVDKNSKILVRLIYDDGKLRNIAEEQKKAKNKSEF